MMTVVMDINDHSIWDLCYVMLFIITLQNHFLNQITLFLRVYGCAQQKKLDKTTTIMITTTMSDINEDKAVTLLATKKNKNTVVQKKRTEFVWRKSVSWKFILGMILLLIEETDKLKLFNLRKGRESYFIDL